MIKSIQNDYQDNEHKDFKYRWWLLTGLGLGLVIINLDVTIINLALPVIGNVFSAQISELQWVNNIYLIAMGGLVITTGKLGDRFGHKLMFMSGICVFLIGSLIASFAPNLYTIIAGRFVQGIGMAGAFGMIFVVAAGHFPKRQQGLVVSILVVFTAAAQSIGPTLGGFIVEHWGWRWAFLINVPVCLVCLLIVHITGRNDKGNDRIKIHFPSSILILISFLLILYAFNVESIWSFNSIHFYLPLIVGLALLVLTLNWQRYLSQALVNLSLFRHRLFLGLLITRACFQMFFGSFLFVLPLYLENILYFTPSEAGLIMLIMTGFLCLSSITAGRFNSRIGPLPSIVVAQFIGFLGALLLVMMPEELSWLYLGSGMVCIGLMTGVMYSSTNLAAVQAAPKNEKGSAYGLFISNTYLWYACGIACAGILLSTVSASVFMLLAGNVMTQMGAPSIESVLPFITGAQPLDKMVPLFSELGVQTQALEWGKAAFHAGFHALMLVFLFLSFVGLVASLLFKDASHLLNTD
ncbi:MFS transporter [Shewanella surugensis]|uniref:MFS transporter n=1 Tax=Shewanella surugensis TaxID=212020 RepID=A0ABT0LE17_9GAMM|nr:MFS transporter [Shewanella surugensis]MCL1125947.1 MFS transporter [Shewanella surugensis]